MLTKWISASLLSLAAIFGAYQIGQNNYPTVQNTSPELNGIGSPVLLGMPCSASQNGNQAYINTDPTLTGGRQWICIYNPTSTVYNWYQLTSAIQGTSVSIGGALLALGGSVSGSAPVSGAPIGSNCVATASDGTITAVGIVIDCYVATANVATVRLSALITGTPPAKTYNVRVIL